MLLMRWTSDKGDLHLELSNSLQISSRELERMGIN
jgi:hypothetical protein